MKRIVFVLFIVVLNINYFAIEFKKLNTVVLEQSDDNFIQYPDTIIVSRHGYIYINDLKPVNIKIYDTNGKFINTFGRKGMGPNEFVTISLSIKKNILLISDFVKRKVYLYDIEGANRYNLKSKIKYYVLSRFIKILENDKILGPGLSLKVKRTKKSLYMASVYDKKSKNVEFLVPATYFFKKKNDKELLKFLIDIVGGTHWHVSGDYTEKYFFIADAFNINIVRVNRKTKKMYRFGKKSKNFTKPYVNNAIRTARRKRDTNELRKLRRGMSYTMGLFTINEDYIGLPFSKYIKKTDSTDVYIQIYKTSGEFVSETRAFKGKCFYSSGIMLYYDRFKKSLYILDTEIKEDFDQIFRVHKYKVII